MQLVKRGGGGVCVCGGVCFQVSLSSNLTIFPERFCTRRFSPFPEDAMLASTIHSGCEERGERTAAVSVKAKRVEGGKGWQKFLQDSEIRPIPMTLNN